MSYISSTKDDTYLGGFGCGPGCGCAPCRSGNRLSEWYERDDDDEPPKPKPPARPAPAARGTTPAPGVSGWSSGLGFYGPLGFFSQAPAPRRVVPAPGRAVPPRGRAAPAPATRPPARATPAPAPGRVTLPHPGVTAQLPASGPGFYTYYATDARGRLDSPPGYHRYALPEVIRALQWIATEWQRLHPRGPRIGFGDLSLLGGGPTPRHGAHQRGLEADIRPLRADGREVPVTHTDGNYSRALTQQLVDCINRNPILRVRVIFFNDSGVRGVRSLAGHNNHLHVGFLPPGSAGPTGPSPRPAPPRPAGPSNQPARRPAGPVRIARPRVKNR